VIVISLKPERLQSGEQRGRLDRVVGVADVELMQPAVC
jgi:hypothetical protein